jgi:outer membrane autotransporter protein
LAYGWHPAVGAWATGAGLALMFPALAQAADECGAATGGAVTCPPGAYPAGITYTPSSTLTLTLQQSATQAANVTGAGLSVITTGGDFSLLRSLVGSPGSGAPAPSIISNSGAAITVSGSGAPGNYSLDLSNPTPDTGIVVTGQTDGIDVFGAASTALTLTNGSVTGLGGAAVNLAATGSASLTSGSAAYSGQTYGIEINSGTASLSLTSGSVSASDAGNAINITTVGAASLSTGIATISGGGGINLTQTGPGGGAISVTTGGAITATATSSSVGNGDGINILAQGASSDPITVTTGGVITASGTGILVATSSAQATTITTNAFIKAGSDGVSASTNGGTGTLTAIINSNILADANNGGVGDAVRLISDSGAISLTTAAGVTLTLGTKSPASGRKDFLAATSTTGAITINNAASLQNQNTAGRDNVISGIFANSAGGAVSVTNSGAIGQPNIQLGGDGIDASATAGVGALTINNSGAIVVSGKAISAATAGTGDINITNSASVIGLSNSAIVTSAVTGQTSLTLSANVVGGIYGVVSNSMGGAVTLTNSASISGVAGGVWDFIPVGVASSGAQTLNNSATGQITGTGVGSSSATLQFTNPDSVQINNSGLINTAQTNHNGYALYVSTGSNSSSLPAVTIANAASGTIDGALLNDTVGSTTLNNAGTWYTANRVSSFGAANTGAIVNSGLIQTVVDNPLGALSTTQFTGLASLTNNGTVSLSNGLAGDSLTISGNYVGGSGSVLKLDIAGGSQSLADELHIGGAASGRTTVVLNLIGTLAPVSATPLITTGAASSPTAFSLTNGTLRDGLTQLAIAYDPTTNVYYLDRTLNAAAFETTRFSEISQDAYYRSQAAWTSHLDEYRTSTAARGGEILEGFQPWASFDVGGSSRSGADSIVVSGVFSGANVNYSQSYVGAQAGVDVVETIGGGSALLGVTLGFTNVDAKFAATSDQYTVDDFNVGAYAAYMQKGWFFNALIKFDPGSAQIKSPYAGYQHSLRSGEGGLSIEAGKRFDWRHVFVEPVISISGVRGSVSGSGLATATSDYAVQDIVVKFGDDTSVRGRFGVRAGMSPSRAFGGQLTPYAVLNAVDEFAGANKVSFNSGGSPITLRGSPLGAYAETRLGANVAWANGLALSVEVGGTFGGNMSGGGGQLTIRRPW